MLRVSPSQTISFKNANGGVYGGAAAAAAMNTLPLPMDPAAFANGGGMFNPYAAAAMAQQQAMMAQQVGHHHWGREKEYETNVLEKLGFTPPCYASRLIRARQPYEPQVKSHP